jgi:hypothetical protein
MKCDCGNEASPNGYCITCNDLLDIFIKNEIRYETQVMDADAKAEIEQYLRDTSL